MRRSTKRAAACLAACAAMLSACTSTAAPEEPKVKLTPPANAEADAAAARAVAKPLEILADRIELMLPPAMYAELTLRQETFGHREFQTKTGRRISLTPPEGGTSKPAWAMVGSWKLASFGPLEVLFAVEPGSAAARVRAHKVTLLARDGQTRRSLDSVSVDDEEVQWSPPR